jgi:uncharacterized protein (DUF697 family)
MGATGGLIGGAVGSVVPGVGTAIGAVAGGAIGGAMGAVYERNFDESVDWINEKSEELDALIEEKITSKLDEFRTGSGDSTGDAQSRR